MERACRLHPGNEDYSREHGRLSTRLAAGEAAPRRGAREEAPRRPPPSSGDPGTDALRQGLHDPGALLSRVHAGELNAALALSELLKDRAALPPRLRDGPAVVRALCACATKWVRSSPAAEPGFRKAYGWFYLLTGMATAWLDMYADGLELAQPTRATRDLVLKETLPCLRLLDADLPRITAVVGEGGGGAFARMAGIAQLGEGAGEMFAQMDVRNNLAALVPVLCQPWSAAAWAQLPTSARVLAQFGAEIAASAYSNPAGQSVAKMRGVCALALRTLVRAAEPLRDAVAADAPGLRGVVALARASADTDAPFLHCLSALMCVASGREAHAELLVRAGVMQVVVDALTRASRQDVHAAEMSTHTFAIGICGFVTATHHDTRALWRCGVVPPLLAKLVDGTEGEKAGAAQILKEGGVLDDVEGLRKYGADAATRARLEASARVPSPAQAALRTACALLDALGAEGRPADEAGTADDTRRRCSNPGCTTRGDGDAPLSRCSGCGQLSYCRCARASDRGPRAQQCAPARTQGDRRPRAAAAPTSPCTPCCVDPAHARSGPPCSPCVRPPRAAETASARIGRRTSRCARGGRRAGKGARRRAARQACRRAARPP